MWRSRVTVDIETKPGNYGKHVSVICNLSITPLKQLKGIERYVSVYAKDDEWGAQERGA